MMNAQSILRAGLCSLLLALSFAATGAKAEEPPLATEDEVIEAYGVLVQWMEAYREKDYGAQWRLIHPRMRRWHNKKRYRGKMSNAQKVNGALVSYVAESGAPIQAEQLPCTEQGHCFRRDIQYIIYIMRTEYEKVEPSQPEWAVMAKSGEGWRFGGGTLLNRPMGETSVILTAQDEARYKPRVYSQ